MPAMRMMRTCQCHTASDHARAGITVTMWPVHTPYIEKAGYEEKI